MRDFKSWKTIRRKVEGAHGFVFQLRETENLARLEKRKRGGCVESHDIEVMMAREVIKSKVIAVRYPRQRRASPRLYRTLSTPARLSR